MSEEITDTQRIDALQALLDLPDKSYTAFKTGRETILVVVRIADDRCNLREMLDEAARRQASATDPTEGAGGTKRERS